MKYLQTYENHVNAKQLLKVFDEAIELENKRRILWNKVKSGSIELARDICDNAYNIIKPLMKYGHNLEEDEHRSAFRQYELAINVDDDVTLLYFYDVDEKGEPHNISVDILTTSGGDWFNINDDKEVEMYTSEVIRSYIFLEENTPEDIKIKMEGDKMGLL